MHVERIIVGKLAVNCFIVADNDAKKAIVIDPGSDANAILKRIEFLEYKVEKIVLTHGHFDHIGAAEALKKATGAPILVHHLDEEMILNPELNHSIDMVAGGFHVTPDLTIGDRDIIEVGQYKAQVLHTPGHTQGGICLYFKEAGEIFVGDTLFYQSVGRTDLPGGNTKQLIQSIQTKIMVLDDDVAVHCGHGSGTTIGFERRKNPFLQG